LFIPRLKSWTHSVVAEGDENVNDEFKSKIHEEFKEAVKVSASALSDIARTNQEVLASKDEGSNCFFINYHIWAISSTIVIVCYLINMFLFADRKILMKLTEALDAQANVFKSFSETLTHIRENRFPQYNMLDEHVQPTPWNGQHLIYNNYASY
jgi:peroxin-14